MISITNLFFWYHFDINSNLWYQKMFMISKLFVFSDIRKSIFLYQKIRPIQNYNRLWCNVYSKTNEDSKQYHPVFDTVKTSDAKEENVWYSWYQECEFLISKLFLIRKSYIFFISENDFLISNIREFLISENRIFVM